MPSEEYTVNHRTAALYTPVLVGLALAVATGIALSPYTGGLVWPGALASGLLLGVLGKDVGEVIVARYDL